MYGSHGTTLLPLIIKVCLHFSWQSVHSAKCLVFKDTYFSYNTTLEYKPIHHFICRSAEERAICSKMGVNAAWAGYTQD